MKTIIIPDVHGRSFWKDAVKDHENDKIVFLGDYLDPYHHEWGGKNLREVQDITIDNFKEIIEFAKANKNVQLLLGNHDCGYAYGGDLCMVRRDTLKYKEIQDLFLSNKRMFDLVYQTEINGKKFALSHAGIRKEWADVALPNVSEDKLCDMINNKNALALSLEFPDMSLFAYSLGEYSCYRGYSHLSSGSIIWSDAREWKPNVKEYGFYQIVGHTQVTKPVLWEGVAFLDCHRAFILDENGDITEMDGTKVEFFN